jgi:hypothetical protein
VILHFAVFIFAPFIRGHAEGTNWGTLSRVAQLGIATEISHDDYFVKGHEEPFFSLGLRTCRDTTSANTKNQASAFPIVIYLSN